MDPTQPFDPVLKRDLESYSTRSSSFMTALPSFQSYQSARSIPGQIRFTQTSRAWIAASEPLTPDSEQVKIFNEFTDDARKDGKLGIIIPVSESLSLRLKAEGYRRLQIGSEPVFDLHQYFGCEDDPLDFFPNAVELKKMNPFVIELNPMQITAAHQAELARIQKDWLRTRKTQSLGFLSQSEPFFGKEMKRIFVIQIEERIQAFICASPVRPGKSYYFSDMIRSPRANAGAMEYLIIETMRILNSNHASEVRMGNCLFALLQANHKDSWIEQLGLRFLKWRFLRQYSPYAAQSLFEFKSKLRPTQWEPLYLVTQDRYFVRTFIELLEVNLPSGAVGSLIKGISAGSRSGWIADRLQQLIHPELLVRSLPRSLSETLARTRVTLYLGTTFLLLHYLRETAPFFDQIFRSTAFTPSDYRFEGLLAGPFFHNNVYHLIGDVLSFFAFGMVLEIFMGSWFLFGIVAAGLWGSNLLTVFLVDPPLRFFWPEQFARFQLELDYGSSNAVYAVVGAFAGIIARPSWLLIPFALNGAFLCFARESWLSIHHLLALGLGLVICKWKMRC